MTADAEREPHTAQAGQPATELERRRQRLAAASVAVIRRHQASSGAYLAAPNFAVYRYSWLPTGRSSRTR